MERKRIDDGSAQSVKARKRKPSGAAVLQEEKTRRLEQALFEEWARHGFAGMRMENIASRAGVGKAALYRRWSSKLEMACEVLPQVGIGLGDIRDTGSLEGDITLLLRSFRALLHHRLVRAILPDLLAELPRNPPLADVVRGRLQHGRRARAAEMFRRAIARGELPPTTDIELACDAVGALVYWRMIMTRQRADKQWLTGSVHLLINGLRASE
ncbi:TetR/AcrR family transcriptional regulator [Cronobacter muytjensii]|nr:TetR/AcrR family transcriptional regulator [Cronobacter muytjensii]